MKYCPYCGASLTGGAASFCPECGRALRAKAPTTQGAKRKRPKKTVDDTYDGYYDDVRPIDADLVGKQRDPDLVKRIACVVAGAIGIIALAVILMAVL